METEFERVAAIVSRNFELPPTTTLKTYLSELRRRAINLIPRETNRQKAIRRWREKKKRKKRKRQKYISRQTVACKRSRCKGQFIQETFWVAA